MVYAGKPITYGDERLPYARTLQSPYVGSKVAAEMEALASHDKTGTNVCARRLHVVFGPGDWRFLPNFVARAAAGRLSREIGSRDKLSDFTYIANLVDAIVAAESSLEPESSLCDQAYFVTNGEPMPIVAFVEQMLLALGHRAFRGSVPAWLAYTAAAGAELIETMRCGGVGHDHSFNRFAVRCLATNHCFSIDKARRDLGFRPAVTPAEGIIRTAAHVARTSGAQGR